MTTQTATAQQTALHQTADAFEADIRTLLSMLSSGATELQATEPSISAITKQTNRQTTTASAPDAASESAQTAAIAPDELTTPTPNISHEDTQSVPPVEKTVELAHWTDTFVRALAAILQKIGDIMHIIASVAAQTNLVALNAVLEAARAGKALL